MVGKKPLHIPASTGEMSQLYATSLPADYCCYCKTSRKRKRGSLAKGARNRLTEREEESLSLNSIAHLINAHLINENEFLVRSVRRIHQAERGFEPYAGAESDWFLILSLVHSPKNC